MKNGDACHITNVFFQIHNDPVSLSFQLIVNWITDHHIQPLLSSNIPIIDCVRSCNLSKPPGITLNINMKEGEWRQSGLWQIIGIQMSLCMITTNYWLLIHNSQDNLVKSRPSVAWFLQGKIYLIHRLLCLILIKAYIIK